MGPTCYRRRKEEFEDHGWGRTLEEKKKEVKLKFYHNCIQNQGCHNFAIVDKAVYEKLDLEFHNMYSIDSRRFKHS